jgi:hypothetical protein
MAALWSQDKAALPRQVRDLRQRQLALFPPGNTVPIAVGGNSEAAARRAGRYGGGFFPAKGSDEELAHLFDLVKAEARANGRDGDQIEMTTMVWSPRRESLDRGQAVGGPRRRPPGRRPAHLQTLQDQRGNERAGREGRSGGYPATKGNPGSGRATEAPIRSTPPAAPGSVPLTSLAVAGFRTRPVAHLDRCSLDAGQRIPTDGEFQRDERLGTIGSRRPLSASE